MAERYTTDAEIREVLFTVLANRGSSDAGAGKVVSEFFAELTRLHTSAHASEVLRRVQLAHADIDAEIVSDPDGGPAKFLLDEASFLKLLPESPLAR